MITTEFFRTVKEAEAFQPCGVVWKEVYSLDKPGSERKFLEERDDAISHERKISGFRAVVKIWR